MRCQICNKETNNWTKNKHTGQYESICGECRRAILEASWFYEDVDEQELSDEDFLTVLEEDRYDSRRIY